MAADARGDQGHRRDRRARADPAALRVALGVEAAYLQAAWDAIDERYGGSDAYLEQALGVDAAARDAIRARLLD